MDQEPVTFRTKWRKLQMADLVQRTCKREKGLASLFMIPHAIRNSWSELLTSISWPNANLFGTSQSFRGG
jgi:hypothetical protein